MMKKKLSSIKLEIKLKQMVSLILETIAGIGSFKRLDKIYI
jgi:hypothetical protein